MKRLLFLVLTGLAVLAGCEPTNNAKSGDLPSPHERPFVAVTNNPLLYFTQRIGGELFDIRFPKNEPGDPVDWVPSDNEVREFQQADLVVLNGAGYENWLNKVLLAESKMLDTSRDFSGELIEIDDRVVHRHGPEGEHSHRETASHVWLDFTLASKQARAIAEKLKSLRPDHSGAIQANLDLLLSDLRTLGQEMTAASRALGDRPVVFSHPVYQYLARRYGLNGKSVHWEPSEPPDAESVNQFRELLESHPAKLMIWEDEPVPATQTLLVEQGVRWIVFSPGGDRRHDVDWLERMQANVEELARSVR